MANRLAAGITAISALAYVGLMYFAVLRGGFDFTTASGVVHLGLVEVLVWFGPAFVATVFLAVEILFVRSRAATVLALAVWLAMTVLREVRWSGFGATEIAAVGLVTLILYAIDGDLKQQIPASSGPS